MGRQQNKPFVFTPTKRRGPIAAEFSTPGPASIKLPSTLGKSFCFYCLLTNQHDTSNKSLVVCCAGRDNLTQSKIDFSTENQKTEYTGVWFRTSWANCICDVWEILYMKRLSNWGSPWSWVMPVTFDVALLYLIKWWVTTFGETRGTYGRNS